MKTPTIKTRDGHVLPKYIRLGGPKGTAMRLVGYDWICGDLIYSHSLTHYTLDGLIYYRDGGAWEVKIKNIGHEFRSVSPVKNAHGKKFFPIDRKEWKKDNGPYAP